MREVEVSAFVQASPSELERVLTPARLIEYEGSFSVIDIEEDGAETVVTAGARGLQLSLRFEPRTDGLYYEQEDDNGPFEAMETWVDVRAENEGSRVTMRSAVDLSLPLPFSDRIAAWKRKGELERALDALKADVE